METIDDIVAEMRKRFEPYAKSGSNDARYVAYLGYAEFADRIEAARKRAITNCNQLKTREALKYLRDASREFCHRILNSKYIGIMDKYKYAEVARIRDAIANAGLTLAAPARNCDVYRTKDSLLKAIHDDRGYLIDPIKERESVVDFVLAEAADVKQDLTTAECEVKK